MPNEARSKLMMMGFLVVVVVLFAVGRSVKGDPSAKDPGFANYSVTSPESDNDSPDLEVDAAAEVESINSGSFKPYLAGDLNAKTEEQSSMIR